MSEISFTQTPQAADDYYAYLEDLLNITGSYLLIDVLANDLGGKAKTLFSISDVDGNPLDPSALLNVDGLTNGISAWEPTTSGNMARINNGKIELDLTNTYAALGITNINGLTATDAVTDTLIYAIRLGNGTLSWAHVDVTIQGQNDAASISGQFTGSIDEDDTTPVTGTLTVTDPDRGESHTQTAADVATQSGLGSYSVDADGHWSYTVDNAAVQYLNANQSIIDTFTVTSLDGTAQQTVTVTINGADEQQVCDAAKADFIVDGTSSGGTILRIAADGSIANTGVSLSNGGQYNYGSAVADFNGDGNADVFLSGDNGAGRLYFGDGTGNFAYSGSSFPGHFQRGASVADVDNDGDQDLFVRNGTNASIMYMNDGSGHFAEGYHYNDVSFTGYQNTVGSFFADFNGDGFQDLYIRRVQDGDPTPLADKIMFNDGHGNFTDSGTVLPAGLWYDGVAIGDVNGDGSADIMRGPATIASSPEILINDGSGHFTALSQDFGAGFHGGLLSDIDCNGTLDAVFFNTVSNEADWWTNDGHGHFTFAAVIKAGASPTSIVDVNNDGYADVVVYYSETASLGVMLNDGLGHFTDGNGTIASHGGPSAIGELLV